MAKPAIAAGIASGQCLCGKVAFEIDVPARWAWHDHSAGSRRAHGAAYATYVGSWRKRFRVTSGQGAITRYEDKATKTVRSFCKHCGTPLWVSDEQWPELVHPFASAIDTELPKAPSSVHLLLRDKASWVEPQIGLNDDRFEGYPELSIEDWHKKYGLWIE